MSVRAHSRMCMCARAPDVRGRVPRLHRPLPQPVALLGAFEENLAQSPQLLELRDLVLRAREVLPQVERLEGKGAVRGR